MKKQINVGVVGCGYWGPNLVRNFRVLADCHLKAMCDVSEERLAHLKSLYPEVEGVTDYDHLLNGIGLDAVVIATSVKLHHPWPKPACWPGSTRSSKSPWPPLPKNARNWSRSPRKKGLVLMVGHTFLYSPAVRKIKEVVEWGDLGEIRYICARRLNLGPYQKDINVAWDLAPHDISIILHIMEELPVSVNCRGSAHVTPGIEDVTSMCLNFPEQPLRDDPEQLAGSAEAREMTIVGSKRMIVYDDVAAIEKIKIYDARVERPPHYDTFGEFHYAYHYGDMYVPYIKQEEPLRSECQHFLDCIREGISPLTDGRRGLELVRILEASSQSLKQGGGQVVLHSGPGRNGVKVAAVKCATGPLHDQQESIVRA